MMSESTGMLGGVKAPMAIPIEANDALANMHPLNKPGSYCRKSQGEIWHEGNLTRRAHKGRKLKSC